MIRLSTVAGATFLLAVLISPVEVQSQTYALRIEPKAWEPMPPNGFPGGEQPIDLFTGQWYDRSEEVEIPWSFNFYGVEYRKLHAHASGVVSFGDPAPILGDSLLPEPIPNPATPNNMVALYWWRLICNSGTHIGIPRSQVVGKSPNRSLVVEWASCRAWGLTSTTIKLQFWIKEGSDDIEVRYGPDAGTATNVYGVIGVENATGTDGTAYCDDFCEIADFPAEKAFIYSPGAQVRIADLRGPVEGFAGIGFPLEYTMVNPGSKPAENFTVQYWVSPEPSLGPLATSLGYDGRIWSLGPRESTRVSAEPRLPIELDEGEFYLIVEADPHHAVDLSNRAGTIGVYGPFRLGIRAANLTVPWVSAPDLVRPGEAFSIRWLAKNSGNLLAKDFTYRVLLANEPYPSPSLPSIAEDSIDHLPMEAETTLETTTHLPAEFEPGIYHLMVELNPRRVVFEHEYRDNVGVSLPVVVSHEDLVILTEDLPYGHIHGYYAFRLAAAGGDGIHRWSLQEGSILPPGLELRTRESARGERATFLEGSPAAIGNFSFTLRVDSGGFSQTRDFELEVSNAEHTLSIATDALASAAFGFDFRDELLAIGGRPPYHWELSRLGQLPLGLQLRSDGILSGRPQQDGTFPLSFRVYDRDGRRASKDLLLTVASPTQLTCVTQELPPLEIGELVELPLHAAGGQKLADGTYIWSSFSLERMALEIGEESGLLDEDLGLRLDPAGVIREAPQLFGTFLWTLEVRGESAGPGVKCPILVQVPRDRGLTVVTKNLPLAIAGRSYRAQLEASGGEGELRWEEFGSGRLLDELGLRVDAAGNLHGTPPIDALEGEERRDYAITFRVEDERARLGLGVVNLSLRSSPPVAEAGNGEGEGGCQTGSGGTEPWAWACALLALILWRRSSNLA